MTALNNLMGRVFNKFLLNGFPAGKHIWMCVHMAALLVLKGGTTLELYICNCGKSMPFFLDFYQQKSTVRSTVVHCNNIPSKEQGLVSLQPGTNQLHKRAQVMESSAGSTARNLHAYQRFPTDRPCKVPGTAMLYDRGSGNNASARHFIRRPALAPQPSIPRTCCFCGTTISKSCIQHKHNPMHQYIPCKMSQEVALGLRAPLHYLTRWAKEDQAKTTMVGVKLVQLNSPIDGIAAASSGAPRKVCMVQFSMPRMYECQ